MEGGDQLALAKVSRVCADMRSLMYLRLGPSFSDNVESGRPVQLSIFQDTPVSQFAPQWWWSRHLAADGPVLTRAPGAAWASLSSHPLSQARSVGQGVESLSRHALVDVPATRPSTLGRRLHFRQTPEL